MTKLKYRFLKMGEIAKISLGDQIFDQAENRWRNLYRNFKKTKGWKVRRPNLESKNAIVFLKKIDNQLQELQNQIYKFIYE